MTTAASILNPQKGGLDVGVHFTFLARLDALIAERKLERPEGSYTAELFAGGVSRIAQKVGEEAVETALAAVGESDEAFLGEAADLVYHLLVLLRTREASLENLIATLAARHNDAERARYCSGTNFV